MDAVINEPRGKKDYRLRRRAIFTPYDLNVYEQLDEVKVQIRRLWRTLELLADAIDNLKGKVKPREF